MDRDVPRKATDQDGAFVAPFLPPLPLAQAGEGEGWRLAGELRGRAPSGGKGGAGACCTGKKVSEFFGVASSPKWKRNWKG